MISVSFGRGAGRLVSCRVSGHAGYDDFGRDIVCAAVTSAVQYTANAMTEVFGVSAEVRAGENQISIAVCGEDENGFRLLEALHLHLTLLSDEYPKTILIHISEV
jgi:uncharacterized protein YsxB (DUF464 family)